MQPEIIACTHWQDFKSKILRRLFPQEPFRRGVYWFRGQRDSAWPLKSSYDRWFEETRAPEGARIKLAKELVAQFHHDTEGISPASATENPNQIIALAQHYGLPTRLLDWTESPYTAAFFAFSEALEKAPSKGTVAVWILDTRSYVWQERGVTLVKVPPGRNARLRNQDGHFTLLESADTCLDDHVAHMSREEPWPLYKFTIPAAEARPALSELDIMGINACKVYPDLQGCSLNARLSVLMRSEPGSRHSADSIAA